MLESKTVWCVLLTANNSFWKRSVLNSMWLKCTLPYILRDVGNPDQFKTGEGRPKAQKCWCLKRILRNIDVSWHFFLYCLPIALHCVECFMSCYLNKRFFIFGIALILVDHFYIAHLFANIHVDISENGWYIGHPYPEMLEQCEAGDGRAEASGGTDASVTAGLRLANPSPLT